MCSRITLLMVLLSISGVWRSWARWWRFSAGQMRSLLAEVLGQYLPSLRLLQQYDDGALPTPEGSPAQWQLTYEEARRVISELADQFPENTLFGKERGDGLRGVIGTIDQGFDGQDLYPSAGEKAASLLYLIIKDHP